MTQKIKTSPTSNPNLTFSLKEKAAAGVGAGARKLNPANADVRQAAAARGLTPSEYLALLEQATSRLLSDHIPQATAPAPARRSFVSATYSNFYQALTSALRKEQLAQARHLVGQLGWLKIQTITRQRISGNLLANPWADGGTEGAAVTGSDAAVAGPATPTVSATLTVLLPNREQVAAESYRVGQKLVVYVVRLADDAPHAPVRLIGSRTHPALVRLLLEQYGGLEEAGWRVQRVKRQPGVRSEVTLTTLTDATTTTTTTNSITTAGGAGVPTHIFGLSGTATETESALAPVKALLPPTEELVFLPAAVGQARAVKGRT